MSGAFPLAAHGGETGDGDHMRSGTPLLAEAGISLGPATIVLDLYRRGSHPRERTREGGRGL